MYLKLNKVAINSTLDTRHKTFFSNHKQISPLFKFIMDIPQSKEGLTVIKQICKILTISKSAMVGTCHVP